MDVKIEDHGVGAHRLTITVDFGYRGQPDWTQAFMRCVREEGLDEARARLVRMTFPCADSPETATWRETLPRPLVPECGCRGVCEGGVACPLMPKVTCDGG